MNTDRMEEMECDASSAGWAHQQDLLDQEDAYIRYEAARVAALVAGRGGHPENRASIERALLVVAGLEEFSLAA